MKTPQGEDATFPDVIVDNQGTIVLLRPQTDEAMAWIEENIGRGNGYQPYWPTVLVEHRFADGIIEGMVGDGLQVEVS